MVSNKLISEVLVNWGLQRDRVGYRLSGNRRDQRLRKVCRKQYGD